MATPPGPASPGNPISFDDLRSEPYIIPNTNISLYLMGTYIYDDGYINNWTFYPNYYPLPSSPGGGILTLDMSISMFYDIDTYSGTDCNWSSGSPPWVSNPTVSVSDSTFLGSGSNIGPNQQTSPLTIASFTSYGGIGYSMEHWYSFDCSVTFAGGPPPPFPPPTNVNVQYKFGAGAWTHFPGSPGTQTSYSVNGLTGLGNGETFYVQIF
jgi:hypothetical protein